MKYKKNRFVNSVLSQFWPVSKQPYAVGQIVSELNLEKMYFPCQDGRKKVLDREVVMEEVQWSWKWDCILESLHKHYISVNNSPS